MEEVGQEGGEGRDGTILAVLAAWGWAGWLSWWGVGRAACSQAGQGLCHTVPGCSAPRQGSAPRPSCPGLRVPIVPQAGAGVPGHCQALSLLFRWQQDAGVALCVKSLLARAGLAVWLSLSLKFPQDVPTGAFALMPTLTKILFFMLFSMGHSCPWLGKSSATSALNHVVLPPQCCFPEVPCSGAGLPGTTQVH